MSQSNQDFHVSTPKDFQNSKIQIQLAKLLLFIMAMDSKVIHVYTSSFTHCTRLVSVLWRHNPEQEYFKTRIEDIRLILESIKRNNSSLISQINRDVTKS